jgi:hypothetical protein
MAISKWKKEPTRLADRSPQIMERLWMMRVLRVLRVFGRERETAKDADAGIREKDPP